MSVTANRVAAYWTHGRSSGGDAGNDGAPGKRAETTESVEAMLNSSESRSRRRSVWHREQRSLRQLLAEHGGHVFYWRACLLPVLEVQVILKERGREELGDLQMLVMSLLARGIRTLDSLRKLTGAPARALERLLVEQEGNGTVKRDASSIELTELGRESLALGSPIRLIHRALRYCAIQSKLLPREAYSLELEVVSSMTGGFANYKHLVPEPRQLVDFAGLEFDLSDIEHKYAVNVTDETVGIESFVGYQPAFLRAMLCLTGTSRPDYAWVVFGDRPVRYDLDRVMPLVETLNLEARPNRGSDKRSAREKIEEALREGRATLKAPVKLDRYGSPVAVLATATDDWLSESLGQEDPWVLLCGTSEKSAMPISRFPLWDVLEGRTMTIYVENQELEAHINLLRDVFDAVNTQYFSRPFREREGTVREFLLSAFNSEDLEQTRKLVERFRIRHAMRWFGPADLDDSDGGSHAGPLTEVVGGARGPRRRRSRRHRRR